MVRRFLFALLLVLLLAAAAFVAWAALPAQAEPAALAALEGGPDFNALTGGPYYVFFPADGLAETGLLLYPGGRVDPRAYAPLAGAIAGAGYTVVIVPMPLNLAVFDADKAAPVMAALPEVKRWAVGGHSLGGAMAARFVHRHPGAAEGLVLWAAFPAQSDSLAERTELAAASIYGTLDGLATPAEIEASAGLLPPQTLFTTIEGGNHAQFGAYGPQRGDNPAAISPAEQQAQVVAATVALLAEIEGGD